MSEKYYPRPDVQETKTSLPEISPEEWRQGIRKSDFFDFKGYVVTESGKKTYVETVAINRVREEDGNRGVHIGAEAISAHEMVSSMNINFLMSEPDEVAGYRVFIDFPTKWLENHNLVCREGQIHSIKDAMMLYGRDEVEGSLENPISYLNLKIDFNPHTMIMTHERIKIVCEQTAEYLQKGGPIEYVPIIVQGLANEISINPDFDETDIKNLEKKYKSKNSQKTSA